MADRSRRPAARLCRLGTRLLAVAAIGVGAMLGAPAAAGAEESAADEQGATAETVDAPATVEPSETRGSAETVALTRTSHPDRAIGKDGVPPGPATPDASRVTPPPRTTPAGTDAETSTDPATADASGYVDVAPPQPQPQERRGGEGQTTAGRAATDALPATSVTANAPSPPPSPEATAPPSSPAEPHASSTRTDAAAGPLAQDTAVAPRWQPATGTAAHAATGSPGAALALGSEVTLGWEQRATAEPMARTTPPATFTHPTPSRFVVATPVRPASLIPPPVLGAAQVDCGARVTSGCGSEADGKLQAPVAVTASMALISPRVTATVSVAMDFARLSGGWAGPLVFNVWLRRQLRERRLSQRQLGLMSGVNHSTISRLVAGTRVPSLETATKLVHALRMDWSDEQVATYFDLLPERTLFPTQRVESALRGDPELDDSDVDAIMGTYLAARSQHRAASRVLQRESDSSGSLPAGAPTGRR